MRTITMDEVRWQLRVEPETTPVRGNALASGNDAEDRKAEDAILRRLADGDIWAWCQVQLVGRWRGIEADDVLGCCSYEDEAGFKAGGYYADMQATVLAAIQAAAEDVAAGLSS